MLYQKVCGICEESFVSRFENAKRCPGCCDRKKGNEANQITTERKMIDSWICKISLPSSHFHAFTTGKHRENLCLRAIYKGKDPYVAWSGRLDVFISHEGGNREEPPEFPVYGKVRLMEVTKSAGNVDERERNGKKLRPIQYSPVYQYLAIDPLQAEPKPVDGELIYKTAASKTTLKGLGRQYAAWFDSSHCLFAFQMECHMRSGRASVSKVIAIVNSQHPLFFGFRENGTEEITTFCSDKETDIPVLEEMEI